MEFCSKITHMVHRKLTELVMEIVRDHHSLKIAKQMRYITIYNHPNVYAYASN